MQKIWVCNLISTVIIAEFQIFLLRCLPRKVTVFSMGLIQSISQRVYADYILPSRLDEYKIILQLALKSNYKIISIVDYYNLKKSDRLLELGDKIIVCRHDVDTDINTAKKFFYIEKELGVRSSYYFRLSTLNLKIMKEIEESGSEASYHYEELSTFCKKHKIKDREHVFAEMEKIQSQFIENYLLIKRQTSLKMQTVASHGDFINRYLNILNLELLTADVREKCGINCDAYDPIIKENTLSISDCYAPIFWRNESILVAIERGEKIINLLTHPRHWHTARWENTKDNLNRAIEGILYHRLPFKSRSYTFNNTHS